MKIKDTTKTKVLYVGLTLIVLFVLGYCEVTTYKETVSYTSDRMYHYMSENDPSFLVTASK